MRPYIVFVANIWCFFIDKSRKPNLSLFMLYAYNYMLREMRIVILFIWPIKPAHASEAGVSFWLVATWSSLNSSVSSLSADVNISFTTRLAFYYFRQLPSTKFITWEFLIKNTFAILWSPLCVLYSHLQISTPSRNGQNHFVGWVFLYRWSFNVRFIYLLIYIVINVITHQTNYILAIVFIGS